MNSIKEFFLSFIESSKDRLKNPMIGAFIMAWSAINWRLLAILLFSNKTIEKKIDFIEKNYFDMVTNLWIPLGFSVFYVLILPYLMALFDWLSQKGIAARKEISKTHRLTDIQNRQEIAAEEWQLEKIREGSPDIQAMKDKIEQLEAQLAECQDTSPKLSEDNEVDSEEISKEKPKSKSRQKQKSRSSSKVNVKDSVSERTKESETTRIGLKDYPVMKDIVIRDLAKTEREWILIYALYSSDLGKNVITRDDIWDKYQESNRVTKSRQTNLSNNLKNMIKSGQLKFINNEEMLLTEAGVQTATEILNR